MPFLFQRSLPFVFAATAFFAAAPVFCTPHIVITGELEKTGKTSVSISKISGASQTVGEFTAIVESDLKRSGRFAVVKDTQSASAVISGEIAQNSEQCRATITLTTLAGTRKTEWTHTFPATPDKLRDAAHALSDFITEKITGAPGMASSKILFTGRANNGNPEIYQCDADGARLRRITQDNAICLSPKWFHNQNAFLYTSWHSGPPAVYKVGMDNNRRELVAGHTGMNQGATPSPDGSRMAVVFSKSGGIDLWLQHLDGQKNPDGSPKSTRLTATKSFIEASPSWSPDGKNIVFTGGEGGASPALHTMSLADKKPARLFRLSSVNESISPDWGANNLIAFCGRSGGRYKIYTIKPDGSGLTLASPDDDANYEDPSWAPNGRHIICTKTVNYKKSLVILDTGGDAPLPLLAFSGDSYMPNWSKK